ncbi:MAG: NifU family protein [bacterium]|nr:NifU family protein [bacterium]
MIDKIKEVIETIKPFIVNDGGDITFNRFENGVVYVSLQGACKHCPMANETLTNLIEQTIITEIPEVIKVINE